MKQLLRVGLLLLVGAWNMSALAYVDVGAKVGVGFSFLPTAYLGDDAHRFYDMQELKARQPSFYYGIQSNIGFFDFLSLNVAFNMNFNRSFEATFDNNKTSRLEVPPSGLWGASKSAEYLFTYHTFALDLTVNYNLKWWYVGGGLGIAINTYSNSFSTLNVFDPNNEEAIKHLYEQPERLLTHKDFKNFISLNLIFESGFNIPISKDIGFFTLGARLKFDMLARNKGIPNFGAPTIKMADYEKYVAQDFNATRNIGNKLLLDIFVGYTHRFRF